MYCKNCGNEIQGTEKFCPKCGNKVESVMGIQSHPRKKKSVKKIVLLVFLVVILTGGVAGAGIYYYMQNDYLYLAVAKNQEGKYGYINEKGEEVIECQYDIAYGFGENGLAAVGEKTGQVDGSGDDLYKWGFINYKGKVVIPFMYDNVCQAGFKKDCPLAVAKQIDTDADGNPVFRWGFINDKGELVIGYKYGASYYSSDIENHSSWSKTGLHKIEILTGLDKTGSYVYDYAVINRKGEEIVTAGEYKNVEITNNGLIWAEKFMGMDEAGKEIYKWGAIDEKGNEMIPFRYDGIGQLEGADEDGLFPVEKMIGHNEEGEKIYKFGYINERGEEEIPFQFYLADGFYNGVACVRNEDYNSGCINKAGEFIIPYQEDSFIMGVLHSIEVDQPFAGTGLIRFQKELREGLINQNGEEIIPCKYEWVNRLTDNLYGGHNGFAIDCYNQNGELLIQIDSEQGYIISGGENGWVNVYYRENDKQQYMDQEGNIVLQLPDKYTYAKGFIKVRKSYVLQTLW